MLLDDDDEETIEESANAVLSVMSGIMLGFGLGEKRPSHVFTPGSLTTLEEVYLTGKAARLLGPDKIKKLDQGELANFLSRAQIPITEYDKEKVRQLTSETEKWLLNRADEWRKNLRKEIAAAERTWSAVLGTEGTLGGDALAIARNAALANLVEAVSGTTKTVQTAIDTVIQTEMASYFQQGQMSGVDQDELVYKVPRESACDQCLRLHVDDDGLPILYTLSEVQGNSNIGVPPNEWDFTIGPVHPHCYCVLFRESDGTPEASDKLAEKKKQALSKKPTQKSLVSSDNNNDSYTRRFMDEVGRATGR